MWRIVGYDGGFVDILWWNFVNMRYNKQELVALAYQNSQNIDREGTLVLKERQDGFFRRSEGEVYRKVFFYNI